MIFAELVNDIAVHMRLVEGGISNVLTYSSTFEIKNSRSFIESMTRGGLLGVIGLINKTKLKPLLYPMCKSTASLAVGVDGYYQRGDADEDPDVVGNQIVDGIIVAIETSYDNATFELASPDSADAIRRRINLDDILSVPLHSYEIIGHRIRTPATHIKILYVPSDFGGSGQPDDISNELHFPVMANTLSMTYGEAASPSGISAANYYDGKVKWYIGLLMQGATELPPLEPYKGT